MLPHLSFFFTFSLLISSFTYLISVSIFDLGAICIVCLFISYASPFILFLHFLHFLPFYLPPFLLIFSFSVSRPDVGKGD